VEFNVCVYVWAIGCGGGARRRWRGSGGIYDPKARNELEAGPIADSAEVEPTREAVVIPTIVEDSAAVAPHDAMKPECKDAVSNNDPVVDPLEVVFFIH